MGKKIEEIASKIYRPEILNCPICKENLKYCYTVSNKVVQFTSGKYFRIKNLGYICPNCETSHVFFSQTANKLCFKGYTYSAKIVCLIGYYKNLHHGREEICDILASKGIEISNRNIDILYKKFLEFCNQDSDILIKTAYRNMLEEYKEIRISIDLITIEDKIHVIFYDYFTSSLLGLWIFSGFEDPKLIKILEKYISPYDIAVIISIRNNKDGKFIPLLKKYTSKTTKFLAYTKF